MIANFELHLNICIDICVYVCVGNAEYCAGRRGCAEDE